MNEENGSTWQDVEAYRAEAERPKVELPRSQDEIAAEYGRTWDELAASVYSGGETATDVLMDLAATNDALLAAKTERDEFKAELQAIVERVENTRLCYFGDHTGHQVQFGTDQIERLKARLR